MGQVTLPEVLEQHRRERGTSNAVLVFDIDSTLLDTTPRHRAILENARDSIPGLDAIWQALDLGPQFWGIREPFLKAGVRDEDLLREVEEFWRPRFFSSDFLDFDQPYEGASEFLHALKARGYSIRYLTGRHAEGMESGTRKSFEEHGFPASDEDIFHFKPDFAMGDLEFKAQICEKLRASGEPLAFFDNEPANVNLFRARFPDALVFFFETITSPAAVPLSRGVYRIPGTWKGVVRAG